MSFSGPTKTCPRCNTVLPAQAAFCGTCGLQFAASAPPGAPPAGGYSAGPTQYAGQGSPGGWQPQGQPASGGYAPPPPGFPPPAGQPGFSPAGQPGYAPYPGAVAAPPRKGGAGKVVVLLLVLVVLVGGAAAAWFLYLNPGRCAGPLFSRHDQPNNVPLPSGCSFAGENHETATNPDNASQQVKVDEWAWTVSGKDLATVLQFYKDNLPGQGWTQIKDENGSGGAKELVGCQGNQVLEIDVATRLRLEKTSGTLIKVVDAPAGGSALGVAVLTAGDATLVQALCSGQAP